MSMHPLVDHADLDQLHDMDLHCFKKRLYIKTIDAVITARNMLKRI